MAASKARKNTGKGSKQRARSIAKKAPSKTSKKLTKSSKKAAIKPSGKAVKKTASTSKKATKKVIKTVKTASPKPPAKKLKKASGKAPSKVTAKPIKKAVKKPADKPLKKLVKKPADKPIKKLVKKPADKPLKKLVKKPADKPLKKLTKKLVKKPVDKPLKKLVKKPVDKPLKKLSKKLVKKPADKPLKKLTQELVKKSADKPLKKLVKKTADEPVKKLVKAATTGIISKKAEKKLVDSKTGKKSKDTLVVKADKKAKPLSEIGTAHGKSSGLAASQTKPAKVVEARTSPRPTEKSLEPPQKPSKPTKASKALPSAATAAGRPDSAPPKTPAAPVRRSPLMRPPLPAIPVEPPRPSLEDRAERVKTRLEQQPIEVRREYEEHLNMSWIHHDSALEGVVYSFQELQLAIDPTVTVVPDTSIQPICDEIRRHKAAIDFILEMADAKKRQPVTTDLIKRIFLYLHPEEGDLKTLKYRKDVPQHRLYFHEYAPPDKIAYAVRQVVEWINDPETRRTRTTLRIAARAHYDLLRIFPFSQDSGKVSRLLMNFLLLRAGYPPAIIHSTERQRYYEALKGAPLSITHMVEEALENSIASIEKYLDERTTRIRSFVS